MTFETFFQSDEYTWYDQKSGQRQIQRQKVHQPDKKRTKARPETWPTSVAWPTPVPTQLRTSLQISAKLYSSVHSSGPLIIHDCIIYYGTKANKFNHMWLFHMRTKSQKNISSLWRGTQTPATWSIGVHNLTKMDICLSQRFMLHLLAAVPSSLVHPEEKHVLIWHQGCLFVQKT